MGKMRINCFWGMLVVFNSLFVVCSQTSTNNYKLQRWAMVEKQIAERGINNALVLNAFRQVERHLFVPENMQKNAYNDSPLPIGYRQTISQPYIVAYMTEALRPNSKMRVLEIGTGSGYQAAILGELCHEVYSIEIVEALAARSKKLLDSLGYKNIYVKHGDGYKGWPQHAPFDAIIVTCAPSNIPQPLIEQLAEGGKMIIPAGEPENQVLYLLEKRKGEIIKSQKLYVRFVPMLRPDRGTY